MKDRIQILDKSRQDSKILIQCFFVAMRKKFFSGVLGDTIMRQQVRRRVSMKQDVSSVADYQANALHEFGTRKPMLLWRYEFPTESFDPELDMLVSYLTTDPLNKNRQRYFKSFIGCDPTIMPFFGRLFEGWVRPRFADPEEKLSALVKMISANSQVAWTGFRISGWVGDNNQTVFRIELFAKHLASETVVSSKR